MSYQYPQYPGQQFPPQFQPGGGQPGGGISAPQPQPPDQPTYTPVDLANMEPAQIQSQQLTNIAALRPLSEFGVKAPADPADYPLVMYNAKDRTTKQAKDKDEEQKLTGQGFSKDPFPPDDPNALTLEALKALQDIWSKAGVALQKLLEIAQQQQKQMNAASAILGAGDQQQQAQASWDQQQFQQQQYPPTGD
jgi:hypothetical protein